MGWFDIIKNLSAEQQRKLLEDLNAPNTEKPKVPPMPNMDAQTLDQMGKEKRRKATMERAGIKPQQPKLPFGVNEEPTTTRPPPDLLDPSFLPKGKAANKPLKPVEPQMVDNKTKDLMSRLQRAAGDLNLVSTLNDYNRMPSKTDAQKKKKRAVALTPDMKKITQAATQMKLGNYKKPIQEIYNKDGSKVSVERQKTLNAGQSVFGNRPIRGPPTQEVSGRNKLSSHVRGLLQNKEEARNRVQPVVNPPVEERQSQKDQVSQRIAEERKKREETLARMQQQREARQPAPSVKDARRARIAASSNGGLPN